MVQRERIAYIDIAKTICITLMVVGHWTNNSILLMYIYSFHMPALFIISGFLYKPHSWKRTIISLGVPVFFYSLINIGLLLLIGELKLGSLFSREVFFRFFHYRFGLGEGFFMGDWFIWSLLGLRLIFGDIKTSFLKRHYIGISIILIIYMSFEKYLVNIDTLFKGWYIGRIIPSLPFFCFGFLLKDIKWNPSCLSFGQVFVLFLLFVFLPIINGSCSIIGNEYGMSYVVFYINAVLSSIFVFAISLRIPTNQLISIISKGTLLILGLHYPFMKILDLILPYFFDSVIPFLAISLCLYPIKLLDKCCPLLLGKMVK